MTDKTDSEYVVEGTFDDSYYQVKELGIHRRSKKKVYPIKVSVTHKGYEDGYVGISVGTEDVVALERFGKFHNMRRLEDKDNGGFRKYKTTLFVRHKDHEQCGHCRMCCKNPPNNPNRNKTRLDKKKCLTELQNL